MQITIFSEHKADMFPSTSTTRRTPPTKRAITLVEMLISMAVTLVMMAAVVNLFANIGTGVRNRRAGMELGSQLRTARARLFQDLAGATSPARPKLPSDDHDDGYLEIIEGRYSDENPSALVQQVNIDTAVGLQHATSLVPRDNAGGLVQWDDDDGDGIVDNGTERNSVRSSVSALGDYDDILALTVRSESEPFTGRMPVWRNNQWEFDIIESDLAEVIWFSVENPADGSLGEPGMRTVYRRVLLIAPWVDELPPQILDASATSLEQAKVLERDRMYYQLSDISYRRVVEGDNFIRVPNTLADLTKRENRFGHLAHPYTGNPSTSFPVVTNYPHEIDTRAIRVTAGNQRRNFPQDIGGIPFFHPFGLPFEWDPGSFDPASADVTVLPTREPGQTSFNGENSVGSNRLGEDVMLNDVLAFDLRVFDPNAPLFEYQGVVLEPRSDSLFAQVVKGPLVGFGAYVDLGWDDNYDYNYLLFPNTAKPHFQEERMAGFHPRNPGPSLENPGAPPSMFRGTPAVYDTWPYHYETDGLDQDNLDGDNDSSTGVDEGTDGLDSDGSNGVDDNLERETQPPYDHPLRAMQAKIRVYDRETRQIREATVTRNFVPQ